MKEILLLRVYVVQNVIIEYNKYKKWTKWMNENLEYYRITVKEKKYINTRKRKNEWRKTSL